MMKWLGKCRTTFELNLDKISNKHNDNLKKWKMMLEKNVCANVLKCSFGDDIFLSFKIAWMEGCMPTLPKKDVHTNFIWDWNENEP
jgi:hypothetical protein